MKKKISKLFIGVISALICLSTLSCRKTFDNIEPKFAVSSVQMYRNVYDADAAVIGIYGKFMGLAGQYVVLNEARADLTDITSNANVYLKQLSTQTVTEDNPYANPRPFYEVIMNCNDALKNFNIMHSAHKLSDDEYMQRYSDIGALRSWLYLQLGIHFGNIPYVTDPIENINDLQNEAFFPKIGFDQLLDNLIQFTESLPYKSPSYPSGSTLLNTFDTYNSIKFFINKNCILGDLYLWKGDFLKAATNYKLVIPPDQNTYKIYNLKTPTLDGKYWPNIFLLPFGERYGNDEIIWNLPFDKNFNPKNPFIDLFSTYGSYLLKPSNLAINNWNLQTKNDNGTLPGTPGDLRGLNASYRITGGQPEIIKYTGFYNQLLPFETTGKWILFRAAGLHLRFAEAANRDGRDKLALALLNDGVGKNYDPKNVGVGGDVTLIMQPLNPWTGQYETEPYYFDARSGNVPYLRMAYYGNAGIRGRIGDRNVPIDSASLFNLSVSPRVLVNEFKLRNDVEDIIIAESALETAFEGNRWGDLLRIQLRRQSYDPNYLANKIGAKFDAANSSEAAAVRSRLANPANWYLPFKWK